MTNHQATTTYGDILTGKTIILVSPILQLQVGTLTEKRNSS